MKTKQKPETDHISISLLPLAIFDGTHISVRWEVKDAFVVHLSGMGFVKKCGRSYIIANSNHPYINIVAIGRWGIQRKRVKYKVYSIDKQQLNISTHDNIGSGYLKQYNIHTIEAKLTVRNVDISPLQFNKAAYFDSTIQNPEQIIDQEVYANNNLEAVKEAIKQKKKLI